MANSNSSSVSGKQKARIPGATVSIEHYFRLIQHRKWLVLGIFAVVSIGVAIYTRRLPNIYASSATILVDPQKVPEAYIKSTVSGDIRNRIGSLSNQILSVTRLQKIIDSLNLYPEERKSMAREDVILKMRGEISTKTLSDFSGSQDLQAFQIAYSGRDPRLVALVTNQLAAAFIDENANTRAQEASGTADFFKNQVQEARKVLEDQDSKIKEFKLKHIGEMPEQETATLQLIGGLQSSLQMETEALTRTESTQKVLESMLTQGPAPVVDMDPLTESKATVPAPKNTGSNSRPVDPLAADRAELAKAMARYGPNFPDVIKLKNKITQEEAQAKASVNDVVAISIPVPAPPSKPDVESTPTLAIHTDTATVAPRSNPVVQSQLKANEAEIIRHKDEKTRLTKLLDTYRTRLDAIPQSEQELASLTRDYEISKVRYGQLLSQQMNAETASELEVRQKGEKFEIVDPAMPGEKPSRPNRPLFYAGGAIAGLVLGLLAALGTELLGMSITDSQDITEAGGVDVLGVIPVIMTHSEKSTRRRRLILAAASATFAAMVLGAILVFKIYNQA